MDKYKKVWIAGTKETIVSKIFNQINFIYIKNNRIQNKQMLIAGIWLLSDYCVIIYKQIYNSTNILYKI